MAKNKRTPEEQSIDPAAQQMLIRADRLGISTAFTRADAMAPCNVGSAGMCCKLCGMGPCRLTKDGQTGVSAHCAACPPNGPAGIAQTDVGPVSTGLPVSLVPGFHLGTRRNRSRESAPGPPAARSPRRDRENPPCPTSPPANR